MLLPEVESGNHVHESLVEPKTFGTPDVTAEVRGKALMSLKGAGMESEAPTKTAEASETDTEARARRSVHVIGASIVLLTVGAIIWASAGGSEWAKKRQMIAIQTAARADLMLVAEAEKRFHEAHGFYTTDLKALNLWPKRVLYAFGFVKPSSVQVITTPDGEVTLDPEMRTIAQLAARRADDAIEKSKTDPNIKPDAPIVLSPLTKISDVDFVRLISFCPDCTATKHSFKVIAAADLDSDPVLDVWTIDQSGKVRHMIDDLQ